MTYQTFRGLLIAATAALVLCTGLLAALLLPQTRTFFIGAPKSDQETKTLLALLEKNQNQLIAANHQIATLLNLPQQSFARYIPPSAQPGTDPSLKTQEDLQQADTVPNADTLEIAFYKASDFLAEILREKELLGQLNEVLRSREWNALLDELDLRESRSETAIMLYPASERNSVIEPWFQISIASAGSAQAAIQISSAHVGKSIETPIAYSARLKDFIAENSQKIYRRRKQYWETKSFLQSRSFSRWVSQNDLRLQRVYEEGEISFNLLKKDGEKADRITAQESSYQVLWQGRTYREKTELDTALSHFLESLDTRSQAEKKEDLMRGYLERLTQNPVFSLKLQQTGLYPQPLPPREDRFYEYYDLTDRDGSPVASFALQKSVGEVYLMDRDDTKIKALKNFLPEDQIGLLFPDPQPEPAATPLPPSPENMEIFLLIGTHKNLADGIMLVALDKVQEKISLISLPRDLYYNRSKINSVYAAYGPEAFIRTISEIIGFPVSKYVSIDMYAFAEIIDIIGGIEIYIERDLIDPTYKIKQMGEWTTLVMRKGTHNLNGLGALRYARSRYTSNDFERAKRQQAILLEVKKKLSGQLSSPQKIFSLFQTMQKYVQTNFSKTEMGMNLLKYLNYQIRAGYTIDTNNILYSTYTNLMGLSEEEQESVLEGEDASKGAYILLPKNNNWDLIHRYIYQLSTS